MVCGTDPRETHGAHVRAHIRARIRAHTRAHIRQRPDGTEAHLLGHLVIQDGIVEETLEHPCVQKTKFRQTN